MAKEGFVPFATTYATFAARRANDFICLAIAEENLDVKICAALPGLASGYGPSHQATEEIAIFRGMPNLTIVDPCDALDMKQAVPAIAAQRGPVYRRLLRGRVPLVLDEYDYRFELGRASVLRDGDAVLIISSGILTMRALEAADRLVADHVRGAVLHTPTIQPLDEAAILAEAGCGGRLVMVAENHGVIGGLGEDALELEPQIGRQRLVEVLRAAPSGAMRPRSWWFWHYRLGLADAEHDPPPMPVRRYD